MLRYHSQEFLISLNVFLHVGAGTTSVAFTTLPLVVVEPDPAYEIVAALEADQAVGINQVSFLKSEPLYVQLHALGAILSIVWPTEPITAGTFRLQPPSAVEFARSAELRPLVQLLQIELILVEESLVVGLRGRVGVESLYNLFYLVGVCLCGVFDYFLGLQFELAVPAVDLLEELAIKFIMLFLLLEDVLVLAEAADQFHLVDGLRVGAGLVAEGLAPAEGALVLEVGFGIADA